MATFIANQRVDTRVLDLVKSQDDSSTISPDMTHPDQKFFVFPGGNVDVTFRGHDFEYSDDGFPIDGIVTSLEVGHNPTADRYVLDYKLSGIYEPVLTPLLSGADIFDGRDTIIGSKFGDRIDGFDGSDVLTGGAGADTFFFSTKPNATNIDRITDFHHGQDKISLDKGLFHGLTNANMSASFHDITSSAEQRDDHILYNHKTGWLSYDSDGKGGHAPVHFATLDHHPTLNYHDFLLS